MNLTFQQAILFLPLVTALLTFFLTSLFTLYKDKKGNNFMKRIFFEYAEYELEYPKNFVEEIKHGEGRVLLGNNGKALHVPEKRGSVYSYTVLRNLTENNAINVKIKNVFSDRLKTRPPTKNVTEEFYMPVWKYKDTLYIPVTFKDGPTNYSTNEELIITYNTSTFEKFRYSFVRQETGKYDEKLEKRYLGFIWIPKIIYQKGEFYKFMNVRENKNVEG